MKRSSLFTILFSFFLSSLMAQTKPDTSIFSIKKVYQTQRIVNNIPKIDGKIDDLVWQSVDWGGDFIQLFPNEGEAPSQETKFKIIYDDRNLYIAFKCLDNEPDKIVSRMSRRDGFEGDWIEVNIDSYNDKRSAFSFTTSVSGVKGDEFISNNGGNWDESWDPIWQTKTQIDEEGWTAEVRIPLSQIRYGDKEEHTWGLQFTRRDFRADSRSVWQPITQNEQGNWVSNFGKLEGLKGIKPQKQIELQPYLVAQTSTFESEAGNPFVDGSENKINGGVDGKIGITGDLTLDFTINPDFGQVEADPGAINIDGYRIFFSERRPFFIENRNLFNYRYGWAEAGGPFNSDNLFYSRRIGSSPHGYPNLNSGEYADIPQNTTILGAAKFSGKTKKGLGIALLESVTTREVANIDNNGERREEVIEPLTNYFVGRLTQDFNEGKTVLGGILTSTYRDIKDPSLEFLHETATTGGLDFTHWFKDRTYFLTLNTVFSQVAGSEEAITRTQTSFEHYFQRPDADYLSVDTTATSLFGHGGTMKFGRLNKNWMFETGVTWQSPKLELNDIGFMRNADGIYYFLWSGYRFNKPFSIFRWAQINYNHYSTWDFGGNNIYQAVNTNMHGNFKNFWRMGGGLTYEHKDISNRALFGGPALRRSRGLGQWAYLSTDRRKAFQLYLNVSHGWGFEKDEPRSVRSKSYGVTLAVQPSDALRISLGTDYDINERKVQNVSSVDFQGETKYITGEIDQRTLSMTLRLNYSITPNLTVQYYGQPFISRGRYQNFNFITDPLAKLFYDRFQLFDPTQIAYDAESDVYSVDENLDDQVDYTFGNPDFSFMQFRSNLVARWEYVPGSELFLVWSQSNNAIGDPSQRILTSLEEDLFAQQPRNTFLVKWTYRFLL